MKGRLTSVVCAEQSSIFAFSADSLSRCSASRSLAEVDILLRLELVGQIIDQLGVEILAAEEGVAVGRLHLEHAVADLEDRDVEGAAAKIVDRDRLAVLLLQAISERGRGRLVDDAQHFEAGDLAGVLGRLALGVVEIGGHGDHRLGDGLAEIGLGGFLHLLEHEGGNLRRAVILVARLHPGVAIGALDDLVGDELGVLLGDRIVEAAADQALHREHGVVGIGDRLALGRLADQALAVLGEGDDRRRRARAFRIFDDLGLAALHDGDRSCWWCRDRCRSLLPCFYLLAPQNEFQNKCCPRGLFKAPRRRFRGDIGADSVATRRPPA